MSILEIQWWFLNRIPVLWRFWARQMMTHPLRRDRVEAAHTIWNHYNARVPARLRFTPLQIVRLESIHGDRLSVDTDS